MNPNDLANELEAQNYDYWLNLMLDNVPNDIDKREGSIIYDAVAPAAMVNAQQSLSLANIIRETYIKTAQGEFLDYRAFEHGTSRYEATNAEVKAKFNDDDGNPVNVEVGDRFASIAESPIFYTVIKSNGDGTAEMQAEEAGTSANSYLGQVLPVTPNDNLAWAEITEITIPARDEENDEHLRARLLNTNSWVAYGGNVADYLNMTSKINDVGATQVYPTWDGADANDWTEMLLRMYTRWCDKKGYKVETLDLLEGDEAGIKSVTLKVKGEFAYGYLKAEKGVHRLVRISPFNANGKRQTSFASVEVLPELTKDQDIDIRPEDLKIDTYRASGAGGQHVNKTESAIRITHLPTGIVVQCQNERSQFANKDTAMAMLKSKLIELKERAHKEKIEDLTGELKDMGWGSQIRSYVFHPYNMVKDHRTNEETSNLNAVMNGEIDQFIVSYLKEEAKK